MPPQTEQVATQEDNLKLADLIEEAFDAAEAEAVEASETEQEAAEAPELPEDEETAEAPQEAAEEGDEKPEFNDPAPERWPAELKEAYSELNPTAKEVFLNKLYKPMQRSHTEATQQLAQTRKQLEPIMQAYEQHKTAFDQVGVTDPASMIQQQIAWASHFARVGPERGLQDMHEAMGIQNGSQGGQDQDEYLTPTERRLQERLNDLEQQTSAQAASQHQREQQAAEIHRHAKLRNAMGALRGFAEAQTPDGQPMHPHVEAVAPTMSRLLESGMVPRVDELGASVPFEQQLGKAYEMACNLDSSVLAATPATTNSEQAAKVAAASRNVTPKAPSQAVPVDRPLTDDISDLYDSMTRGGRR